MPKTTTLQKETRQKGTVKAAHVSTAVPTGHAFWAKKRISQIDSLKILKMKVGLGHVLLAALAMTTLSFTPAAFRSEGVIGLLLTLIPAIVVGLISVAGHFPWAIPTNIDTLLCIKHGIVGYADVISFDETAKVYTLRFRDSNGAEHTIKKPRWAWTPSRGGGIDLNLEKGSKTLVLLFNDELYWPRELGVELDKSDSDTMFSYAGS